jgi:4-hydroxy-3-methylbut-2-enyl diphosphate reductase
LGVEEVSITDEDEYFPPPREIRELLSALETAVHATLAVPVGSRVVPVDREIAASEVLASLAN